MLPQIRKILYATDLSPNARHAFSYAVSIADRCGAMITILHVVEEVPEGAKGLVEGIIGEDRWEELKTRNEAKVLDTIKTRLEKFCDDVSEELPACRSCVDEIKVILGYPANQILSLAETGGFDMLVMGTHGHGMIADAMIGSTARRVLRRCTKPVLVIRLPE